MLIKGAVGIFSRAMDMALDVLVQIARFTDGTRRITHVSEVLDLDSDGNYQIRDLFLFKGRGKDADGNVRGDLEPTGLLPTFAEQIKVAGLRFPKEMLDAARARRAERERRRIAAPATPAT